MGWTPKAGAELSRRWKSQVTFMGQPRPHWEPATPFSPSEPWYTHRSSDWSILEDACPIKREATELSCLYREINSLEIYCRWPTLLFPKGFPKSWLLSLASSHSKHLQKHILLLKRSKGKASVSGWHKKKAEGTKHYHWNSPQWHNDQNILITSWPVRLFSSESEEISLASRLWRDIASNGTII